MKKTLLIGLACLALSPAFAQKKEPQKRVAPGLRAGLNISSLSNSEGGSRNDFYLGFQLPIKLTRFYTLQPEFNYSRQGASDILPDGFDFKYGARSYEDLKLNYLEANVINKFYFGKFNLLAGPGLAILTESHKVVDSDVDLTFNIGIGVDITKNFGIEARFKQGIIPVAELGNNSYNGGYYNYYYSDYQFNQTFQIGAYFKF